LLVNSSRGPGFVFPKGKVSKKDACPKHAAMREAMEEAGVVGDVLDGFDYRAQYKSCRVKRKGIHPEGLCDAQCFVMMVAYELDEWPEMDCRERQWCNIEEAKARCKHAWMQDALCEVEERLPELVPLLDVDSFSRPFVGMTVETRREQDPDATIFHFA